MGAIHQCISAPSSSATSRGLWTVRGMAILLLAGCSTSDETPVSQRVPGIIVDSVSTTEGLQEVEYRDAKSGARYRLLGSLGEAGGRSGWIESRAAGDESKSVKIEWSPTTVQVTASKPDGTAQFWFAGRSRGFKRIDVAKLQQLRDASAATELSFLLHSATHADALLDASQLATQFAVARELVVKAPTSLPTLVAQTFACDHSLDISENCGVDATLTRANKEIFSVDGKSAPDKNSMKLQCGDTDGIVRIQACPVAAYDCKTFKNAKTESTLTVSAPANDTTNNNEACKTLRAENEGVDVGKKFEVKGLAEIRPGRTVRPKDPGDDAKHPVDCKLVWDFPDDTDDVYHVLWGAAQGNDEDTKKLEVSLTAGTATGNNAIGGKTEIHANVHTCQDDDVSDDDYAIVVRGTKTNVLYTCAGP